MPPIGPPPYQLEKVNVDSLKEILADLASQITFKDEYTEDDVYERLTKLDQSGNPH